MKNTIYNKTTLSQIPRGVWVLGLVSLFMDISSEMIHSLLPLFMMTAIGMSAFSIGILEGLAESTALVIKVFSGVISDYLGKRKILAIIGYGLSAFTKPIFALAATMTWISFARIADRVGKGIRGAPRDALVADITPAHLRGSAYGLRQALDSVGAFSGPLLAVVLMFLFAKDFRLIFWIATIPAVIAVLLLFFGLNEPKTAPLEKRSNPIRRENLRRLDMSYWWVVGIGFIFTLARFSEAFLVLRAQQIGVPMTLVPLIMVAMNLIYSASAYPLGKLSDHMNQSVLLAMGLIVLIIADLVLASSEHWMILLVGVLLWGVHMGMTQGLLAAMVSRTAPADLRGTAFGVFNLVSGLAMLMASTIAGFLWDSLGAASTFYAGCGFCALALLILMRFYCVRRSLFSVPE